MRERACVILVSGVAAGLMGAACCAAVTPNDIQDGSDSDRIEAAIAEAVKTGARAIEIPRVNAKREEPVWLIDRAVLLPSDFTLVLRDCLIRLSPGTQDNIIRNAGTAQEPMEGNENIRILGVGRAALSGGVSAHFNPPGDRSGWRTIGVLLCGVKRFTIEGLTLEETQAWAVSVENGCSEGRIANLTFRNTNRYPNQDGVDIRKGCHDILIENITGETGDDTVALTGLRNDPAKANPGVRSMQAGGNAPRSDDDIYNITVRNVRAKVAGGHHIVRLLNHDGIRLYNVFISDVTDTSVAGEPRVQAGVKIGDLRYASMSPCQLGDTFNIFVKNVRTRGKAGVRIQGPLKNAVLRDIVGFDGCTNGVERAAPSEHVVVDASHAEEPPVIGAWFWSQEVLEPDGFKPFLDAAAAHTPYTLLTTSCRRAEAVEPQVHEQVGLAVRYANARGLKMAQEVDLRLARQAFRARYPGEQQEELVLQMVAFTNGAPAEAVFLGSDAGDHMNGSLPKYECLTTRLVRAYSFVLGPDGIEPATVKDITGEGVCALADGPRKLTVRVPAQPGRSACVIAAHTCLTPDVFAPHLLAFQRSLIRQYADLPLAGIMKDEWGFPPDHTGNPAHDRYWYSEATAGAYARESDGRDLVRDALLMCAGETGRERERQAAINRYWKICRERNAAIEDDFYRAGKETFGLDAFVVTHATWTPYPGAQEFRKNGLDWWQATRDIGQSDESTPYPCRTSLAKRWGFPLWYNQTYAKEPEPYVGALWSGALGGGRLNVHPLYPRPDLTGGERDFTLMRSGLMAGLTRLRMLDFITRAPLDCPVAVVFGHACAMNWAGPSYNRVGMAVAGALCEAGYPADLFPSSLVGSAALRIDAEGYVCLGPQRYRAVVLYQPEFGDEAELAFFEQAARGKSAVFQVGDWTRDAAARPLDGAARLGSDVRVCSGDAACAEAVTRYLAAGKVERVTGWTGRLAGWGQGAGVRHATPPTDGHSVLTDGTYVRIAGGKNPAGDPICETFVWQGQSVTVDAVGVVAIRFALDGNVAAFAAGGLKRLKAGRLDITLQEQADLAFITERDGKIKGVFQGRPGDAPAALLAITPEWRALASPAVFPASAR